MEKKSGASIFTRLVLVSFCALFLIYGVMAWLIVRNTNATRDVFIASRHAQASAFAEDLSRQLNALYVQESNLVHHQAVRILAYGLYGGDYEKYQLILSVMRSLQDIAAFSPMVEEAVVRLPQAAIRISSLGGYAREAYDASEKGAARPESRMVTDGGRLCLRISYPLMYSLSEDYVPDMVISLYLSRAALGDALRVFADDMGSGASLVFQDEEALVSAGKERAKGDTFLTASLAAPGYPLSLRLSINNRALNRIIAQDIGFLSAVTVLAGVVFVGLLLAVRKLIHKPLNKMVGAFQDLREGRFEVRLHHRANDEFRYLYGAFNDTVGQLKASMDRVIEQERLISSAELAQLQSQIDPHFLYNSFFIISRMAKSEDYEQIDSFVTSLARYYRFINKTRQDVIPLAEEAEHMRNYADILQMRFGDVISIRVQEVPDPFRGLPVPKLILQPLIENAYEHGVKDKPGDGLIQVSYQCEEGELHILIEDNGELAEAALSSAAALIKAEDEKQKAHALYNIHRRLRLCCGAGAGLDIRRSSLGGFAALVRIPLGDKLIKK